MFVRALIISVIGVTLLAASDSNSSSTKKERIQKAVQKEIEKEKKYAKEQRFYNADEYDFKAKEIDPETLKSIEAVEPDYDHTDDWGVCDSN